jgi:cbb3-type cytochrome oxidase maturation protein
MNEAAIAQVIMTFFILVIFLGFLIWGIKSKQFRNIEDAKYRVFDNGEETDDVNDKTGE